MKKILGILTVACYLMAPAMGCCNFKELDGEAEAIVTRLQADMEINKEDILKRVSHLHIDDSGQVGKEAHFFQEDKYADFQELYSDSLQKNNIRFSSFARICKNIYDDNSFESIKPKVAVHLLFREVFKKLENLEKMRKKNETQNVEFEKKRMEMNITQEVEYFLDIHKTLSGSQTLKFPQTWGQDFSIGGLLPMGNGSNGSHVY